MDKTADRIYDGQGKACFFDKQLDQLRCHQPGIEAPTGTFAWARNPKDTTDIHVYLAYGIEDVPGGRTGYVACPGNAPGVASGYEIFSIDKRDKTGCFDVGLVQQNGVGDCVP